MYDTDYLFIFNLLFNIINNIRKYSSIHIAHTLTSISGLRVAAQPSPIVTMELFLYGKGELETLNVFCND